MDNQMPRKKRQDYDRFAISRAIDQVQDPALRLFLEATADVVTGISGNAQLSAIDAVSGLRREFAAERADRALILQYLERQEVAATQQRADFQALFEVVNGHDLDIGELKQAVQALKTKTADHDDSRDASIAERRRLTDELARTNSNFARLETEIRAALARIEQGQLRAEEAATRHETGAGGDG